MAWFVARARGHRSHPQSLGKSWARTKSLTDLTWSDSSPIPMAKAGWEPYGCWLPPGARRARSSYATCDADAVISAWSYAGATSTRSAEGEAEGSARRAAAPQEVVDHEEPARDSSGGWLSIPPDGGARRHGMCKANVGGVLMRFGRRREDSTAKLARSAGRLAGTAVRTGKKTADAMTTAGRATVGRRRRSRTRSRARARPRAEPWRAGRPARRWRRPDVRSRPPARSPWSRVSPRLPPPRS